MKISIENFKSIERLHNFEIKPFTILSGVNSAGKSSFIQLLLILKQTVEANNEPFVLNDYYYNAGSFEDVISQKDVSNSLSITFEYNKRELADLSIAFDSTTKAILNSYADYDVLLSISYKYIKHSVFIKEFSVKVIPKKKNVLFIKCSVSEDNKYIIETGNDFFAKGIRNEDIEITSIDFTSFFPRSYEKKMGDLIIKEFIKVDWVKTIIKSLFDNISYLAPNREHPRDSYPSSSRESLKNVGIKGEFTAQILETKSEEDTKFYAIDDSNENGISYNLKESTLADAVKYWMCDYFKVAENIEAKEYKDTYIIILTNKSGLETSIKHVGFGISQLLPIIVEGLRMPTNGTLIIEQPEIHLHPKLQSKLYDFLYSLTKQGKKVIVETHSSHFITRMRRRVAEDETNEMDNQIGLTFIEENIFRSIKLDDYGTMDYYPEDFIEQEDEELRAIVKAQMKKRMKNEKDGI